VLRSEIFQIIRRNDPDRYLHLLAFVAHQYYRLQDNLVDAQRHFNLLGEYDFSEEKLRDSMGIRLPKLMN
jgi:hypothetical protein